LAWRRYNHGRCPMNCGPRRNRSWRSAIRGRGDRNGSIGAWRAAGGNRSRPGRSSRRLSTSCARAASGKHCRIILAVAVRSTSTSSGGGTTGSSCACGGQAWPNTTKWKGSLGLGRVSTAPWARRRSAKRRLDPIRPIGGKKGTKRSLLVDALGAPLSLIVSGANRHDVKLLDLTLDGIVVRRPKPTRRRPQHLCADKAYRGKPADAVMRQRGYTPHVRQIRDETRAKRRGQPARRWVVERSHSWFNRFQSSSCATKKRKRTTWRSHTVPQLSSASSWNKSLILYLRISSKYRRAPTGAGRKELSNLTTAASGQYRMPVL
jgi:transposase